jgi:hypothetical protein
MRRASRTKSVAIGAVAIGLGLAGCASDTATNSQETSVQATNPSPAAGPTTPPSGAPPPPSPALSPVPAGHYYSIVDFIRENHIAESQLRPGGPGAPTVNLPTPPGWADAGSRTPTWAWRAIYLTDPAMAADPPSIITLVSKLTGSGVARVLSYAPGELRNMADFKGDEGTQMKVSGFNAYQLGGTFTRKDGVTRAIVQTTVVFPASDGVFIMQSNADGGPNQLGLLRDTMRIMAEQTTITP